MKNKKTILIASALALVVLLAAVAIPLSMNTTTPSGGGDITNNTDNNVGDTGNTDDTGNTGDNTTTNSGTTENCTHIQGSSQYAVVDDEGHVVFAACTKCGTEMLRRFEDHIYDGGKCTVCKRTCTHNSDIADVYTFDGQYSIAHCAICGLEKPENSDVNPNASFTVGSMSFEFGKGMTWQDFIEDPTGFLYGSNVNFIFTEYEGRHAVGYCLSQEVWILFLDGAQVDPDQDDPVDGATYTYISVELE